MDAATAPRMGEAVNRQLKRRRRVVLDLHDVDFMDLHGLAVLLRATRRAVPTAAVSRSRAHRNASSASWASCTRSATSGSCRTAAIRSTPRDQRYLLRVRSLTDSWTLGGLRLANRVVLAPLAGIGNWFVRLQAKRHGAGLVVSEMVSSFGLVHGDERTLSEFLRIHPDEHPVSMQLSATTQP